MLARSERSTERALACKSNTPACREQMRHCTQQYLSHVAIARRDLASHGSSLAGAVSRYIGVYMSCDQPRQESKDMNTYQRVYTI
jgi:hypothetical protein